MYNIIDEENIVERTINDSNNFNLNFDEMTEKLLDSNLNSVLKTQIIMILNEYMKTERDSFVNANAKEKTSMWQAVDKRYYECELNMPMGSQTLRIPETRDGEFSEEIFERYKL